MKLASFIRELLDAGCTLKRHGNRHDIYVNPRNGKEAPVPRHAEIKDSLCALIRKQLGIESSSRIGLKRISGSVSVRFQLPTTNRNSVTWPESRPKPLSRPRDSRCGRVAP
ncbi:MAG: type II toxin-antitoxin system HicA family toxin [Gammaproteobacteria bacterium]